MAKRHPSLVPLSHDHHHGLALALRCRKHALGQLHPGDPQSLENCAAEVYRFLETALLPHFEAEERILFAALSGHARWDTTVAQLETEHRTFRGHLSRQRSGSGDQGPALRKFLFDFGDLLERHIRIEERELFPLFEELIPRDEAERVGIEIKEMLKGSRGQAGGPRRGPG